MPLVDEAVSLPDDQRPILNAIKLRGDAFVGASWSDVLQNVSTENHCLLISVPDSDRLRVSLRFENVHACPTTPAGARIEVCDPADC